MAAARPKSSREMNKEKPSYQGINTVVKRLFLKRDSLRYKSLLFLIAIDSFLLRFS